MDCIVCKSGVQKTGLLSRCLNSDCGAVRWDKPKIRNLLNEHPELKELSNPEILKSLLRDANVPDSIPNQSYVYVIRLRGQRPEGTIGRSYVGMTSHHPYRRYLNHIRGYDASRFVKRYGTAMLFYEGPMSKDLAEAREPELAEHLRSQGYDIKGGH